MSQFRSLFLFLSAVAAVSGQVCEWSPDFSGGKLDLTFYITSDSEIGRGRPVSEYVRYQKDLVAFSRGNAVWPGGFRSAGKLIGPPAGIVTTGDNIYGGSDDATPITWLIQRWRFEWLWSRSRVIPPLDAFVDPSILQIEKIPYPVYPGLGNHDWDLGSLQDGEATLLQHIRTTMPGCYGVTNLHYPSGNYSWNWGRLHLVQLNEWAGARAASGLEWLRQDLSRLPANTPVVFFQHYGFDGFSRSGWWSDANRAAFLDVACNYNVLGLFTGHTHHAFPADRHTVACPAGRAIPAIKNFVGEDGIIYNETGTNEYYGNQPQGVGTFMVVRVVDDGSAQGSFMDVATVSWPRNSSAGTEIRASQNCLNFIQSFPFQPEPVASFRNLDLAPWKTLGPAAPLAPAVAIARNGSPVAFSVGADRVLRYRSQGANGIWTADTELGIQSTGAPVPAKLPDGGLGVFVRGDFGGIYFNRQNANDTWAGWQRVGGFFDVFVTDPVIATLRDSRLVAFAIALDGGVYQARQLVNGNWSNWEKFGGPVNGGGSVGNPAVARTDDGRLVLLVRGSDSKLYYTYTVTEYGNWTPWAPVGARLINGDPAAVAKGDRIWLFARDQASGRLWSGPLRLGLPALSDEVLERLQVWFEAPQAFLDGAGNIRVLVRGSDLNLHWNRYIFGASEYWSGWNRLPSRVTATRGSAGLLSDGRVQVATVEQGSNNVLYTSDLRSWAPNATPPSPTEESTAMTHIVQTSPCLPIPVQVDSSTPTLPATVRWTTGTVHTLTAPQQWQQGGLTYVFQRWADRTAGQNVITVSGPISPAVFTAVYTLAP